MSKCCGDAGAINQQTNHSANRFENMIPNCLAHATRAKAEGKPIVGIMCEFTPRELIMAAGAIPVCLCGGSNDTIADAEQHLPPNLCPLIKSTYGYHLQKSNPFLEMADLVIAETTCDGKKKMYELMARSRPMVVLELPQKSNDSDAAAHWRHEMNKLKVELEQRFDTTITDDALRDAIKRMNRERALRRTLADFMQADPPPLTGRMLIALKSSISGQCEDFAEYEQIIKELGTQSTSDKPGTSVRVLMTGVPIAHGAERVLDIAEDAGGVVVAMENCTGLKPIVEDVDETAADPLQAIADKYFHLPCSVMTPNDGRLRLLRELTDKYQPQCVIDLVWQACLTYDVESHRVKQYVEHELHLPYLKIETDYSPADTARIAVRIEALYEMVRS